MAGSTTMSSWQWWEKGTQNRTQRRDGMYLFDLLIFQGNRNNDYHTILVFYIVRKADWCVHFWSVMKFVIHGCSCILYNTSRWSYWERMWVRSWLKKKSLVAVWVWSWVDTVGLVNPVNNINVTSSKELPPSIIFRNQLVFFNLFKFVHH